MRPCCTHLSFMLSVVWPTRNSAMSQIRDLLELSRSRGMLQLATLFLSTSDGQALPVLDCGRVHASNNMCAKHVRYNMCASVATKGYLSPSLGLKFSATGLQVLVLKSVAMYPWTAAYGCCMSECRTCLLAWRHFRSYPCRALSGRADWLENDAVWRSIPL